MPLKDEYALIAFLMLWSKTSSFSPQCLNSLALEDAPIILNQVEEEVLGLRYLRYAYKLGQP